jgi:hypothetical protein
MLLPTSAFAFRRICGSHSAFQCKRGAKYQHTIFRARVGAVWLHKKHARTHYTEIVFLHPVGYVGHVVDSGGPRHEIDALFFRLGWALCRLHKKGVRTRYTKIVLLHQVGSLGNEMNSGASGGVKH